jgi:hypothetical protein
MRKTKSFKTILLFLRKIPEVVKKTQLVFFFISLSLVLLDDLGMQDFKQDHANDTRTKTKHAILDMRSALSLTYTGLTFT